MEIFFDDKEKCYFAKDYIDFLNKSKTEREATENIEETLKKANFKDIKLLKNINFGDKVYFNNKNKGIFAAVIGEDKITNGVNIIGSHIDSPRLDLRPHPLYEKNKLNLAKTHYYGGIKKYQWTTIPLSMHGIVYNKNGEKININIGSNPDDPVFTITDLLPHLAENQMELPMKKAISGEDLNILIGKEKSENIFKEKYGIDNDFEISEIEFVPEINARLVGIDENLIGGYGQDDRSSAYTSLRAITNIKASKKTAINVIIDKEEIGSYGNTSISSNIFDYFIEQLILKKGEEGFGNLHKTYINSKILSADVNGAADPNYMNEFEEKNAAYVGNGINFCKYTGSKGKNMCSDANVEYMNNIKNLLDKFNINYQFTEMGKLDIGGGGTIAYILSSKGAEVIDCGVPLLSMHSPFEIIDKNDLYETYKTFKIFFENMV